MNNAETTLDGTTLVVRIPMLFQRRGGRKRERYRPDEAAAGRHARQGAPPGTQMAAHVGRGPVRVRARVGRG